MAPTAVSEKKPCFQSPVRTTRSLWQKSSLIQRAMPGFTDIREPVGQTLVLPGRPAIPDAGQLDPNLHPHTQLCPQLWSPRASSRKQLRRSSEAPGGSRARPTWEVAPVGDGPVSGGVEAVVVPGGQVDDAVVELIPLARDQLAPEGAVAHGCGQMRASCSEPSVPPGRRLQGGLSCGQRVSCPQASLPPQPSTCWHPAPRARTHLGGRAGPLWACGGPGTTPASR